MKATKIERPKPQATPAMSRPTLALPTERSVAAEDIQDLTMLIYGEKKVGKTSFAAQFPDALSFMYEPGAKMLEIFKADITFHVELLGYIDLLRQETRFRTLVIDTVDEMFSTVRRYTCKKFNIAHPQDRGFGVGWDEVTQDFDDAIRQISALKRGVIYLSHTGQHEFKTRSGATRNKVVPSLNWRANKAIADVDVIGCYTVLGIERHLIIQPSDEYDAGHRCPNNFLTRSGERVRSIPMGSSSEEAYANFIAAFNNEQLEPGFLGTTSLEIKD